MRWRVLARALLVHGLWTVGLGAEELPTLAEFSQRLTDAPVPEAPRGIAAARPSVEDRGVAGAPPPIEVKERLWTLDLAFDLVVEGTDRSGMPPSGASCRRRSRVRLGRGGPCGPSL